MQTHLNDPKHASHIAFDRFHLLVKQGYRPIYEAGPSTAEISSIELRHPKVRGKFTPPPITLWSNGIVSTSRILWPRQHVPTSEDPAAWQKFIDASDEARFDRFIGEVPQPDLYDRYMSPAFREGRIISFMAIFAVTLCGILGLAYKLVPAAISASA